MIFVTVGTQLPFPRLIGHMIEWAKTHEERVVLQTGDASKPLGCEAYRSLSSEQFSTFIERARVVVSHAGIGSIIAAKSVDRPIILVPRHARLGEHRNDHQLATAAAFEGQTGLRVAWEVSEISSLLDQTIEPPVSERNPRYDRLVHRIKSFVAA
ncbi:UDP-N-acetylglucosamine transferase subunit ALG13 [Litoreibacter meonggei]|uniref:UDP-N-acetylglucosamine transferase subunit ALG13 n=1 Tax=Litoreibacter meonggei TaxID=1049199 RepID=A0A497VX43_9RHOB|nr:UDP-N-acetylglucosamine transferase subunit ALG13 [Litoreibacter meonggei]